jgi:hypothetical protein
MKIKAPFIYATCLTLAIGCNGSPSSDSAANGNTATGSQVSVNAPSSTTGTASTQPVGSVSTGTVNTAPPTASTGAGQTEIAGPKTGGSKTPPAMGKPVASGNSAVPVSKGSLIGLWDVTNKLEKKSRTYEFRDNGTYILIAVDAAPDNKGTVTITQTGTFKLEGDKYSRHVVDQQETTDDEIIKSTADADTKQMRKDINKIPEYRGTLKFKDADDAVITAAPGMDTVEQEIDLKRHKG